MKDLKKFFFPQKEHTINNILYYLNGLYPLYPELGLPTASYSFVGEQFLGDSWEMGQGPAAPYVWGHWAILHSLKKDQLSQEYLRLRKSRQHCQMYLHMQFFGRGIPTSAQGTPDGKTSPQIPSQPNPIQPQSPQNTHLRAAPNQSKQHLTFSTRQGFTCVFQ